MKTNLAEKLQGSTFHPQMAGKSDCQRLKETWFSIIRTANRQGRQPKPISLKPNGDRVPTKSWS